MNAPRRPLPCLDEVAAAAPALRAPRCRRAASRPIEHASATVRARGSRIANNVLLLTPRSGQRPRLPGPGAPHTDSLSPDPAITPFGVSPCC